MPADIRRRNNPRGIPPNNNTFNRNLPVSKQRKADLIRLARHFNLEHEGQLVTELRDMLKKHLEDNYAQYATNDVYKRLYGRQVQAPAQQPVEDGEGDDDGDEWQGIADDGEEDPEDPEDTQEPDDPEDLSHRTQSRASSAHTGSASDRAEGESGYTAPLVALDTG